MQAPPNLDEPIVAFVEHVATTALADGLIPTPVLDTLSATLGAVAAAAAAAAAASATPVTTSPIMFPSSSPLAPGESEGDCELVGPFALIVQGALGALALLSLVFKRWKERPQRPVKIWFFDVSKQVFGSVLVHIANVFMSMLTSGRFHLKPDPSTVSTVQNVARMLVGRDNTSPSTYTPNPCSFYLLNLAIDTTVGIPILIFLLHLCTRLVSFTRWGQPPESIQSGYYGDPPNAMWWLKQSILYFCGLFGMKLCVLVIFILFPWISRVGDWALRWTEGNEKLQIIFVMMLFPLIMNALQYYIIDSFIKQRETPHERLATDDPDAHSQHSPFDPITFSATDSLDSDSDDGDSMRLRKSHHSVNELYDPEVDGDVPTVVGSSSSQLSERGRLLPTGLFSKE